MIYRLLICQVSIEKVSCKNRVLLQTSPIKKPDFLGKELWQFLFAFSLAVNVACSVVVVVCGCACAYVCVSVCVQVCVCVNTCVRARALRV